MASGFMASQLSKRTKGGTAGNGELSETQTRSRFEVAAIVVTFCGFAARVWAAHGTFLNPDEALHFRLANQPSLALAYRESLTASHPPLLTLVLYYWRALGTSELWLRMPLILASMAFCWIFYKWLSQAANDVAGLVGLLFVAFLPPIVVLSAEIRQYPLMLMFLAGALYFLDDAFEKKSARRMAAFSLCLYLAMLSHYSAFWFAAALGIYALVRIFTETVRAGVAVAWVAGQVGGIALAAVLYKTHISKLGAGYAKPVLQGWMSDEFLSRSYFHAGQNSIAFLVGHSFGVFQYFWGQLAIGDGMGLLFVAGVVLLLRANGFQERLAARRLGLMLVLPFAIACGVSVAHIYPYGGTRHAAFLIIPAIAGVSVAIGWIAGQKWMRGVALAVVIVLVCVILGKPRRPWMTRANQSKANMAGAVGFVSQNVKAGDLIFTDYQSELLLGHYLCEQRVISFDAAPAGYEKFRCDGRGVVSEDYKTWTFDADFFLQDWPRLTEAYRLKPGTAVWVIQMGWDTSIADGLRKNNQEFRNVDVRSFGKNITVMKLIAGEAGLAGRSQAVIFSDGGGFR